MFSGNFDAWTAFVGDLGSVFSLEAATGRFETWAGGNYMDFGPLYPFVGWEWVLWIIGMACWIIWQIWHQRHEEAEYRDETEKYATGDKLVKAIRGERVS